MQAGRRRAGNSIEAKTETDMQIWKLKGLQKHVTTTMINRDWHEPNAAAAAGLCKRRKREE